MSNRTIARSLRSDVEFAAGAAYDHAPMNKKIEKKNPTKPRRRGCLVAFGVLAAAVLIVALGGLWYVNDRWGAVTAAPAISLSPVPGSDRVIYAAIDPGRAAGAIQAVVESWAGRGVPAWMIGMALPHALYGGLGTDYDSGQIALRFLLNERRLGPLLASNLVVLDIPGRFPEISWGPAGVVLERRGAISLDGDIPMEPEAREAVWYSWNQSFERTPLELDGGHAFEILADNRSGGAYLAVASLLEAFDYELNEDEQKISLSSLKFVVQARASVDLLDDGAAMIVLSLEIAPEAVERVGIVNLKVGIDEGFDTWTANLDEQHGIDLTGASAWKDNVIEWRYTLDRAADVARLAIEGNL